MIDRREQILDRLTDLVAGVEGVQSADRNHTRPDEELLPAVVVFDGDEVVADMPDGPNPNRWRDANAPQMMTMRPEIYVRVASDLSTVGTNMNALRAKIHKAICSDTLLASLVGADRGKNGRIQLERVQTALGWGRTMEGEMILYYAFSYILNPADL